jgi:hypothetical protein
MEIIKMSEYHSLLSTYKIEMDSPYNDGYSQLHYKEQYDNLLKIGEKDFTQKMLNQKIQDLEHKISALTNELNVVKSQLSGIN